MDESLGGPRGRTGLTLFAVRGGSMRPAIQHGDLIVATSCRRDPRLGEVVLIKAPVGIVAHRLAGSALDAFGQVRYRTAGDANRGEDLFLAPRESILGIARVRLRWLGYPSLWAEGARDGIVRLLQR